MDLRELFRHKLGNAELTPDPSVGRKLMRRVALREFLHFNPARFNIYYLGAILGSLISAAILLSPGDGSTDQVAQPGFPEGTEQSEGSPNIDVYIAEPQSGAQDNSEPGSRASGVVRNNRSDNSQVTRQEDRTDRVSSQASQGIMPVNVSDSFSRKGLFAESNAGMNKLQSGFKDKELLFESSATEGCAPLKVSFDIKPDSFDSCKWIFGDGGYSYDKNPEWIFDVEGNYNVILYIFTRDGSKAIYETNVLVHPRPVARFEISPDRALLDQDEIRVNNYSTNAVKFRWDFGDGSGSQLFEPRHRYSDPGSYDISLIVTSDYGCSDSVIVRNALSGSAYSIDFPNAFIPNNQGPSGGYYSTKSDEAAQVFHPVSAGVSDYQLKIFSKIGILIFESNDITLGWDGYFKGQICEPGVYIWKVRGNFLNGEPFTKMGDLTLLKQ